MLQQHAWCGGETEDAAEPERERGGLGEKPCGTRGLINWAFAAPNWIWTGVSQTPTSRSPTLFLVKRLCQCQCSLLSVKMLFSLGCALDVLRSSDYPACCVLLVHKHWLTVQAFQISDWSMQMDHDWSHLAISSDVCRFFSDELLPHLSVIGSHTSLLYHQLKALMGWSDLNIKYLHIYLLGGWIYGDYPVIVLHIWQINLFSQFKLTFSHTWWCYEGNIPKY